MKKTGSFKKALFLDRDGVINREKHYLYKIEDFEFVPGVITTLRTLSQHHFGIFIITNQSGIARGKYTDKDYQKLTQWMLQQMKKQAVDIQKVYYCPHHPQFSPPCTCRKPLPGMIHKAQKEFHLNLQQAVLVGDKNSDIASGVAAGIKHNFLVKTGHLIKENPFNVPVLDDLTGLIPFLKEFGYIPK